MPENDEQPAEPGTERASADRTTDHGHPGQEEQDVRIAGVHGWGYGGRPKDAAPAASSGDHRPASAVERAAERPADTADDVAAGGIARTDLDGDQSDQRG